jgi:hypothetical protein
VQLDTSAPVLFCVRVPLLPSASPDKEGGHQCDKKATEETSYDASGNDSCVILVLCQTTSVAIRKRRAKWRFR